MNIGPSKSVDLANVTLPAIHKAALAFGVLITGEDDRTERDSRSLTQSAEVKSSVRVHGKGRDGDVRTRSEDIVYIVQ